MKDLDQKAFLKIVYYLTHFDGDYTYQEKEIFEDFYQQYAKQDRSKIITEQKAIIAKQDIMDECNASIREIKTNARDKGDFYNLFIEKIDEELNSHKKFFTVRAFTYNKNINAKVAIWNLVLIASIDGFSKDEHLIIDHIARKLKIQKDEVFEIENRVFAYQAIENEEKFLRKQDVPNKRQRLRELRRRKEILTKSVIPL